MTGMECMHVTVRTKLPKHHGLLFAKQLEARASMQQANVNKLRHVMEKAKSI